MQRVEEVTIRLVEVARTQQEGMRIFQEQLLQSNQRIEEMQVEIRGLQVTANRILERLEQHMSNGHGG